MTDEKTPDDQQEPAAAPAADPSGEGEGGEGMDRRNFLESLRKITVYAVPTAMILAADSKAIAQSGGE